MRASTQTKTVAKPRDGRVGFEGLGYFERKSGKLELVNGIARVILACSNYERRGEQPACSKSVYRKRPLLMTCLFYPPAYAGGTDKTEPSLTVGLVPRSRSTRSLPLSVLTSSRAQPSLTRGLLTLLTLAVPTIPTKITPTRVFQLAGTLRALADHRGHDRARDLSSTGALLFAESARGIRMAFQAAVGDHDTFGHGLFGRSQKALVEPDGVRARHFVQAIGNFRRVKSTAQHLGSQHADTAADGTGGKDLLNHLVIVIDGDVEVLSIEWNPPGRADQFARALETNRALLARRGFCFRQTARCR